MEMIKKWWRDEDQKVIKLPTLELLHDTKTRWDSRYFMVNRLQLYCQVHCDNKTCGTSNFQGPTGCLVILRLARTPRSHNLEVD